MKATLLLLTVMISGWLNAQTESSAIREWQSLHPATLLISAEHFHTFSTKERQLLGTDYIVFDHEITLQLLEQHSAVKNTTAVKLPLSKDADAVFIKQWTGQHPDVKILTRSYYDSLAEEQQLQYAGNPSCLILAGETLTVQDIEAFGH